MLAMLVLAVSAALDAHAGELTFDLRLQDGHVPDSMRLIRVKQGDVVTLRWTVDRPTLLHLHGYDIQCRAAPAIRCRSHANAGASADPRSTAALRRPLA